MKTLKKYIPLFLAVLAMTVTGCRAHGDDALHPDAFFQFLPDSYSEQFDLLWNCINSSYVFWDVDTVDWDKRYEECLPLFADFDRRHENGDTIRFEEYRDAWRKVFSQLIDHHLSVKVVNPYCAAGEEAEVVVNAGIDEVMTRDYYHPSCDLLIRRSIDSLETRGRVSSREGAFLPDSSAYCLSCLIDDSVAYFRFNSFMLTSVRDAVPGTPEHRVWEVYEAWLGLVSSKASAAVIDCRSNGGGYCDDLALLFSPFMEEDLKVGRYRSKQGMGRMDYSPWCPMVCPATADSVCRIPVVVLTDVMSVSMAELCAYSATLLPEGCVIGERTFGATGPLVPGVFELTFGGPFGSPDGSYYVYTSTFEWQGRKGCLEGIGVTPDIEVRTDMEALAKGMDVQLEAAFSYLRGDTVPVFNR